MSEWKVYKSYQEFIDDCENHKCDPWQTDMEHAQVIKCVWECRDQELQALKLENEKLSDMVHHQRQREAALNSENEKLKLIIENGLGPEDLKNE